MPIQFRCRECRQVLSVSSKRAGSEVTCPACKARIQVPTVEDVQSALDRASAEQTVSDRPRDEVPEPDATIRQEVSATTAAAGALPAAPAADDAWHVTAQSEDPWSDEYEEEQPLKIKREPIPDSGMDMTPMVDVTFLLLIFFMITASFSLQRSLQTSAPEPEDEGAAAQMTLEELEEESVVVTVDSDDVIYVDDVAVGGLGELNDLLAARASEGKTDMLIETEYGAKHGTVVSVHDAGLTAQMQNIRISSRSEDE